MDGFSFLVLQPPKTLMLSAYGNVQHPSEAEFYPPLPQQNDQKLTSVSNPLLISIMYSNIRRMVPPVSVNYLVGFTLLSIAWEPVKRLEGVFKLI